MQDTIKNRTIFCDDNLDVMRGIDSESIDLIYLDPPFNKDKKFTAPIGSSAEGASFKDIFREEDVKKEWLWTIREDQLDLYDYLHGIKGVGKPYNFAYLAYMAIRLLECRRILKETGSIYLHCDHTMSHYLKTTMDCIFGENNFGNEVIWHYKRWPAGTRNFQRMHDILLRYTKSDNSVFNIQYQPYSNKTVHRKMSVDGQTDLSLIRDESKGTKMDDVWDISYLHSQSPERTGYPTQKPLALLERIIKASSNEGDVVLDPFCGCATTCVAAEKLDREWIGIDVSVKAYKLVQERLKKEVDKPQIDFFKGDTALTIRTDPPKRTDRGEGETVRKWVYIISNEKYPGEYKVGIASNVKSRLNSYQVGDPNREYKLEFEYETACFRKIESYIHKKYENKHEWVRGDLEEIKADIVSYKPSKEKEGSLI